MKHVCSQSYYGMRQSGAVALVLLLPAISLGQQNYDWDQVDARRLAAWAKGLAAKAALLVVQAEEAAVEAAFLEYAALTGQDPSPAAIAALVAGQGKVVQVSLKINSGDAAYGSAEDFYELAEGQPHGSPDETAALNTTYSLLGLASDKYGIACKTLLTLPRSSLLRCSSCSEEEEVAMLACRILLWPVLTILIAVPTASGQLEPLPFLHSQRATWIVSSRWPQASPMTRTLKAAIKDGPVDWTRISRPESKRSSGVRRGQQEGFLLFTEEHGKPRRLPLRTVALPFPSTGLRQHSDLAAAIPIPHRLVKFRIYPAEKTLQQVVKAGYPRIGVRRELAISEDGGRATMEFHFRKPGVESESVDVLPSEPFTPQPDPGTKKTTVYVRKVGQVVFHAWVPLDRLDLRTCAKRIMSAATADQFVAVFPPRLPRQFREEFAQRVRRAAAPSLQKGDIESEREFRTRTVGARWVLDAVDAIFNGVTSISCRADGNRAENSKRSQWEIRVNAKAPVLAQLSGQPAEVGATRLSTLASDSSDHWLHVKSQLPDSIREPLMRLVDSVAEKRVSEKFNRWIARPTHEFVLCAETQTGFRVKGAIVMEGAKGAVAELATLAGQSGSVVIFRQEAAMVPYELALAGANGVLYVAIGDNDARESLGEMMAVELDRGQRGGTRISLSVDLAKLVQRLPDDASPFSLVPTLALHNLERLWFDQCKTTQLRDLSLIHI